MKNKLSIFKTNSLRRYIGEYLIYFAPVMFLAYLALESYQMDYRAFYLGGKAILYNLDPYLNHVGTFPEFFGANNSDAAPNSGFRYPPFAALIFAPLGAFPYETSKLIFSGLILLLLILLCFHIIEHSNFRIKGETILFVMTSFPVVANLERGQADVIVVYLTVLAFLLFRRHKLTQVTAFLIALASCIKIFPLFLLLYYGLKRKIKLVFSSLVYTLLLFFAPLPFLGQEVYRNFLSRTLPSQFGNLTAPPPVTLHGQEVINNQVFSVDTEGLTLSRDFVHGYMNPFLKDYPLAAVITAILLATFLLLFSQKCSPEQQFFSLLNTINILNPQSWIMGLVWYTPLFLYLFDQANNRGKFLLLIPLFMPPFTNTNAMFAYVISLAFIFAREYPKVGKFLLSPSWQLSKVTEKEQTDRKLLN